MRISSDEADRNCVTKGRIVLLVLLPNLTAPLNGQGAAPAITGVHREFLLVVRDLPPPSEQSPSITLASGRSLWYCVRIPRTINFYQTTRYPCPMSSLQQRLMLILPYIREG